jgi:hypothetical protein
VSKVAPDGHLICTYTDRWINPLDPDPEQIDLEDIAHALSNLCRFTGHCFKFYSVAQHSVHVSEITDSLWGLLHDASEAYLSDIARPVKLQTGFGGTYRRAETRLQKAVTESFKLPWPMPPEVKDADDLLLGAEMRDLMPYRWQGPEWDKPIDPWLPPKAKRRFLERYELLKSRK